MTLKVTGNHRLLAERGGELIWVRAGELLDGDLLVGPEGELMLYDAEETKTEKGAFDVYNFSFSSKETGMVPTYLVSEDGENWIVAHNVK